MHDPPALVFRWDAFISVAGCMRRQLFPARLSGDREKGTFFDHEAGQGGGALDLVSRETGLTGAERMRWLEDHGLLARPNGGDGRPGIVRAYLLSTQPTWAVHGRGRPQYSC